MSLSATGLIAGPDNPPVIFAKTGFRVFKSKRTPISVFIIVNPSAPAASTAFAIGTMSVTLGESFTYNGTLLTALQALTSAAATSGSVPKACPPCLTLGHEIFNSMTFTLGASPIFAQTAT